MQVVVDSLIAGRFPFELPAVPLPLRDSRGLIRTNRCLGVS